LPNLAHVRLGASLSPVRERRSLTPQPIDAVGGRALRRTEVRTETSARVVLQRRADTGESLAEAPPASLRPIEGWSLNESRGGARLITEEAVELGAIYDVRINEENARPGQVVWLQNEPDGMVVGIAFLDVERASVPPVPMTAKKHAP
jgi:hypothetical protein